MAMSPKCRVEEEFVIWQQWPRINLDFDGLRVLVAVWSWLLYLEGRKEGRKEGKEGREGRKEGRKEGFTIACKTS